MTDPRFFRQYLDILNEGPPPGVGPNAPIKKPLVSPNPAADAEPSKWQQAKTAIGQQYDNYKDTAGMLDAAAKQGQLSQKDADDVKGQVAGSMIKAGVRAGLKGGDPGVYVGSMMGDMADQAASLSSSYRDIHKQMGPGSEAYKKLSPDQQQAFSVTPDDYDAMVASGKQAATQMMNPQAQPTGPASGFSPKANELFGLDPTRQATDAELDAAAKGTNEELDRLKQLIRK